MPLASLESLKFRSFVFTLQTSFWVWKKNEPKNYFGSEKDFGPEKKLGQKKCGLENFKMEKILVWKFWVQKNFGTKKMFGQKKNLGAEQN